MRPMASKRDGEPEDDRPDAPPTSRLGRLARLGSLAARTLPAGGAAIKRAMGLGATASEPERLAKEREALRENARKTAEAMLKTLGEMKGLPLKLGQMASYIDGLAPPGYEEKFQDVLKQLQAKAPPLSREAARKVVSAELGVPEEVFSVWEAEPFAAASIGQVHRATTHGGEQVAVKVQYPGIDKAIENDLKSVSMLEQMMSPVGRRYHTKETLDEIKSVFLAELDYSREASATDMFRAIHEEDADIVIPRVHHSLSTRRVLTTELIGGVDYKTFCADASPDEKRQAAETIWRFMMRALFRHGVLYADPHPGNYRFLGGGKVAFLDFGCHKILSPELLAGEKRYILAAMDERWDDFERACVEFLGFDPTDEESFRLYLDYTKFVMVPLTVDAPYRHTPEAARETVAYLARGLKKIMKSADSSVPVLPKPIHMPTEHTFMNRLQWGLASVMGGLGAEGNYHRITRDWIRGPHLPPP